jgi:HEAT repeat protein
MFQIRLLGIALLVTAATLSASAQTQPYTSPGETQLVRGKTLKAWMDDLRDSDPSVRNTAILAIPEFGPAAEAAVPRLIEHCLVANESDAGPRCDAVIILPKIKIAEKDIPRVIETLGRCLSDPQAVIRYQAAVGLVLSGDHARGALRDLITAAKTPQSTWQIREKILVALQRAGRDPKGGPEFEVIKIFLDKMATDKSAHVRQQAVIGLGALGRPADPKILLEVENALLLKARGAGDKDKGVQIWANASLMALDKVNDDLLKRIGKLLKDPKVDVRIQAALALGTVGDKAKAAVPALLEMLDDAEKTVVCAATDGLLQIQTEGCKKAVIDNLKNAKDAEVRAHTAQAVGAYGDKMLDAIPTLISLLNDKEPYVAQSACYALAQMGNSDARCRQALLEVKERKDAPEKLRKYAEQCIQKIDQPPPPKRGEQGR